jgi:hypothetical protein
VSKEAFPEEAIFRFVPSAVDSKISSIAAIDAYQTAVRYVFVYGRRHSKTALPDGA